MQTAPIALFVYNRPWHTRQTVEALQRNELAAESELIVFSDGEKAGDGRQRTEDRGQTTESSNRGAVAGGRRSEVASFWITF